MNARDPKGLSIADIAIMVHDGIENLPDGELDDVLNIVRQHLERAADQVGSRVAKAADCSLSRPNSMRKALMEFASQIEPKQLLQHATPEALKEMFSGLIEDEADLAIAQFMVKDLSDFLVAMIHTGLSCVMVGICQVAERQLAAEMKKRSAASDN